MIKKKKIKKKKKKNVIDGVGDLTNIIWDTKINKPP